MDKQSIKLWYDPEADLLEVVLQQGVGVAEDTEDDRVEVRVDEQGRILSFHVLGLRSSTPPPLSLELKPKRKAVSRRV
jgi:uncharacterized protein YuzE